MTALATGATPPTLLIRADGGPGIGAGHLMRCLALAQAHADRGGRAVFLTNQPVGSALGRRLLGEGFAVEPAAPGDDDAETTLDTLLRHRAGALVVDGYGFDSHFQTRLHSAIEPRSLPLLWIDDQAHAAPYVADLVLNQNPHATPGLYARRAPHTRLLLGPCYALLRRELLRSPDRREPSAGPVRQILVTLGGGDADNVTARMIEGLARVVGASTPRPRVEVVVGALNPHLATLRPLAAAAGFELLHDVADMAPPMAAADLALSAAGSTCWELAFMGLPALVVALADNQRPIAQQVARHGMAVDLGWHGALDAATVAAALSPLLADGARRLTMARKGRQWVDGRGAERVLDALASCRGVGPRRWPRRDDR